MGLEGSLADFVLTDVIQLVHMGKKTGALHVTSDEAAGTIFFLEGTAIHAVSSTLVGDRAVSRILQWRNGNFIFKSEETTNQRTVESPIQHLVMEVARQIDEWNEIKKLVPNLDMVIIIDEDPNIGMENIKLEPTEWKLLAMVDGNKSIRKIAEECAMTEFEVSKIFYGLLSSGLVKSIDMPRQEAVKIKFEEEKKEEGKKPSGLGRLFGKKK